MCATHATRRVWLYFSFSFKMMTRLVLLPRKKKTTIRINLDINLSKFIPQKLVFTRDGEYTCLEIEQWYDYMIFVLFFF